MLCTPIREALIDLTHTDYYCSFGATLGAYLGVFGSVWIVKLVCSLFEYKSFAV